MDLDVNLPINNVSFGQVSVAILKELFKRNFNLNIFPIGNQVDLSSQKEDKLFFDWIKYSIEKAYETYSRKNKIFKLWHINGSLESFAEKQILFSFYELDSPTNYELNIVKNNENVIFSSNYACEVFKNNGCNNVKYIPLFYDSDNFHIKNKNYFNNERITFNLVGKLEKRKNHKIIIQSWLEKYGNNGKYFLQCAIYNPFIKPEDQQNLINSILEGKRYFNISFFPYIQTNEAYNDFLNSADIIIGMSGGEGWGLPEFHSVALGKHAVILNAHSYKDWANKDNSVLVEPSSKIEAYDNLFFHKGNKFNQGNIFTFTKEDFIEGCEMAINRFNSNKINTNGIKLQEKFTINNTVDELLQLFK